MVSSTRPDLNPIINTNTRLAIMAVLAPSAEMEFATVRDLSNLSDSALSKQAAALEAAGYLSQRKATSVAAPEPGCPSQKKAAAPPSAHTSPRYAR